MSRLLKTIATVALMTTAPVLAACAQQPSPESHGVPMGDGMMTNGGTMGGGMMGGGMMGMHPDGSGGQMQDMNQMMTMMTQMNQMMATCNAMMQDHKMHSSGGDDGNHGQM